MPRSNRKLTHYTEEDASESRKQASDALQNWIKNEIQPAVGTDVRNIFNLGTNQGKALALLFYLVGAIDIDDYTLRPLDEWLF